MRTELLTGWYVIYVRSRFENKVHESLKEIEIESFLPLVKTIRQWSDRKKIIHKPLFPSYVFAQINSSLDFYKALSVHGATGYIKFGNEYACVSQKEITKLKLLTGTTDIEEINVEANTLEVGEKRVISLGALQGLECEILNVNNVNNIIVRIESLQQTIKVTIPSYYLDSTIEVH